MWVKRCQLSSQGSISPVNLIVTPGTSSHLQLDQRLHFFPTPQHSGSATSQWFMGKCPVWSSQRLSPSFYADALIIGRKQFAWTHWQLRRPPATSSGQETWELFKSMKDMQVLGGAGRCWDYLSLCSSLEASEVLYLYISRSPGNNTRRGGRLWKSAWGSFTPEDVLSKLSEWRQLTGREEVRGCPLSPSTQLTKWTTNILYF